MHFHRLLSVLTSFGNRRVFPLDLSYYHLFKTYLYAMTIGMHGVDQYRDESIETPLVIEHSLDIARNIHTTVPFYGVRGKGKTVSKHKLSSFTSTLYMICSFFHRSITRSNHLSATSQQDQAFLPLISKALAFWFFCLCLRSQKRCWATSAERSPLMYPTSGA
jgi:hypothetical protein